jgi:mRNA-degrading endonuclease RelE of RelBE toxin-antitoxin system
MVEIEPEAAKQIDKLAKAVKLAIYGVLLRLEKWPDVSGAKPLKHGLKGQYRIRTGHYRVQFRVEGSRVIVEKAGHRDGFYED